MGRRRTILNYLKTKISEDIKDMTFEQLKEYLANDKPLTNIKVK